ASGITQATISRIESGQVEELKSESLKSLATALGVTVDYLVGRTDRQSASDIADADPAAKRLLEKYEALSPVGRHTIREFVDFVYRNERGGKNLRKLVRIFARIR